MIAKGNNKIKDYPDQKDSIRKFINKQFIEWGYKQEYADEVLNHWLGTSENANYMFEGYLQKINSLKDDELYNDNCLKSEIPPEQLRKFAVELANKL